MYQYNGWSNVRMQPQQPPGLPAGWEAKWDPNNKKWFYVDHNTKTTHWQLPSSTQAQPSQARVTTSFISSDPSKVKTLMSEYDGVDEEYLKNLLKMYQNNIHSVRKNLAERGYKKKKPPVQPKMHFVSSLKSQYPAVDEEIIKQTLVSTNNNFVGARTALEAMGYKRKIEDTVKQTPKKTVSKPKATKSTTAASTSTSSDLSEATKRSRLEQLKKKFPTIAESVIELALIGTMYDMNMASEILKSSIEAVYTKSSTTLTSTSSSRPTKTKSKQTKETRSPERKPEDFAPIIFGADDKKDDHLFDIPSVSTIYIPPQSTYTKPASGEYKKREYKAPPRKVYQRQTYAPVTGYKSENRSKPVGPDPTLAHGPDPTLLQTQLIKPMGPDRTIRQGAQRSNRCGPIPSNAQGRAGIDVGPMRAWA